MLFKPSDAHPKVREIIWRPVVVRRFFQQVYKHLVKTVLIGDLAGTSSLDASFRATSTICETPLTIAMGST
jgi:hypothetical protein